MTLSPEETRHKSVDINMLEVLLALLVETKDGVCSIRPSEEEDVDLLFY